MYAPILTALIAPMLSTAALADTVQISETTPFLESIRACELVDDCSVVHLQSDEIEAVWVVREGSCTGAQVCVGQKGRLDYAVERTRFGPRSINRYFHNSGPAQGMVGFYEIHRLWDGESIHEFGVPTPESELDGHYAQITPPDTMSLDDFFGEIDSPPSMFDNADIASTDISALGDYMGSSFSSQFQTGFGPMAIVGVAAAAAAAYGYSQAAEDQFEGSLNPIKDALDNSIDNTVTEADARRAAEQVQSSQETIATAAHAPWVSWIFGSNADVVLTLPEGATLDEIERILYADSDKDLAAMGL